MCDRGIFFYSVVSILLLEYIKDLSTSSTAGGEATTVVKSGIDPVLAPRVFNLGICILFGTSSSALFFF